MKFTPPPLNPVIPATSLPSPKERLAIFPTRTERPYITQINAPLNLTKKPKCLR